MPDQAAILRQVIDTAMPCAPSATTGPPMIVVTGGRAGVGTTTVAVNLAAVLADRGERVLLVEAAEQRANMREVAGVRPTENERSLSDVLAGNCGSAEAMAAGPAGTMVLAHGHGRGSPPDFSRHAQQRLSKELQVLGGDFDLIVIDAGSGLTPWTRRFWLRSRLVLLVTTTDGPALLDSYAAIKLSAADAIAANMRLLVNQCDDDRIAADAHRRLSGACQRFLARTVSSLPSLPRHAGSGNGDDRSVPRVWEAPSTPFGHATMWLGRAVSDLLSTTKSPPLASAESEQQRHTKLLPC